MKISHNLIIWILTNLLNTIFIAALVVYAATNTEGLSVLPDEFMWALLVLPVGLFCSLPALLTVPLLAVILKSLHWPYWIRLLLLWVGAVLISGICMLLRSVPYGRLDFSLYASPFFYSAVAAACTTLTIKRKLFLQPVNKYSHEN